MLSHRVLLCNIAELRLSVRSANCLRSNKIVTIGDLVQKSETDLQRLPNFEHKSLNEIKEALAQRGLRLGMQIASSPPVTASVALAPGFAGNQRAHREKIGNDVIPAEPAPFGPGHDHVNVAALTFRTDEPLAPLGNGGMGAILPRHLGGIRFDPMMAIPAPYDQPDLSSGSIAECHRWRRVGFHPRRGDGSTNWRYRQSAY
jgi:hypothetical protein